MTLLAILFLAASAHAGPEPITILQPAHFGSTVTFVVPPIVSSQAVVTASRASGNVYQNTSRKPIFVKVIVDVYSNAVHSYAYADASNPPTVVVGDAYINAGVGFDVYLPLMFWVMPGHYYKVTAGTAATIISWVEWY